MANYMSKTKKELVEIIAGLEQDNAGCKKEAVRLEKEVQSLSQKTESLQAEMDKSLAQNADFQKQIQELSARAEQVQQEAEGAVIPEAEEETALDEAAALLDCLADASSKAIFLLDPMGMVRYAGPAACALLGVENPNEVAGQPFASLCLAEDSAKLEKKILKACLKGEKKKIKDVLFKNSLGRALALKIAPVVYKDEPAVKVTVKD
ncbi:PAS fold [Desulfatibacillum alkenivorans DSM 16219]|jgi:PAS domain-containing protein|uniref:PAS fold n=1 Tax=Desulfatibacillum alkenivorans DSM 16219 TaxID=1121393 RepID=A0A1M6XYZ1_9BACT|nr:PAS domain-containing protein [Desulfatibacillum alkenivorans]SHL11262.1 PAS fold [Desulfatibacillum alkenivorans DSM 16219]